MASVETISATEFKARCLELFDRLNGPELEMVQVTKRGKVVALVRGPALTREAMAGLHGGQKGTVNFPSDFDWTAPVLDEPWIDVDDETA